MRKTACLCAIMAAFFAASCGGLNVPKPTFETREPPPEAPLEPSELEIPVSVSLKPIVEKAEAAAPKEIATGDWETIGTSAVGDLGVKYRLWRDPLQVTMHGNKVVVTLHAYFWLNVAHRVKAGLLGGGEPPWRMFGTCGQTGEAPREMVFTLETELAWNERWGIEAKTRILPNIHPVRCAITALEVDVTQPINADVRPKLEAVAALIDRKIMEEADFSKLARDAWLRAQQPGALDENVWLLANPESIYVTPLAGDAEKIETRLRVVARPEVVGGGMPMPKPRPLPPLRVREPGEGLFRIRVRGELPFAVAAQQILKRLSQTPFEMGARRVAVEEVVIYPSGEQCVLQLKVKGSLNGRIYFMGKPVYDGESDTLSFEGLDYSIATRNVLQTMGDWLLHEDFRQRLLKMASLKVGGELESLKGRLEKGVSRPLDEHTRVQATVAGVKLKSFYMTHKAFKVEVVAHGSARVIWQ